MIISMKSSVLTIAVIVGIVLFTFLLVGEFPTNLTGAVLSYPSLEGKYCRQTVDPFTGIGAVVCDSSTQVTSVAEGSLRKPGQIPLLSRYGGSTYLTFNQQRRCSYFNCDLAYPILTYTRLPYSRAPSFGLFSRERWCNRDPDRCTEIIEETPVKFLYLQGSPYNYRQPLGRQSYG